MEYETKIRVQYYETDRMGVVHHSNYIRYFETARTEWLRAAGRSYAELEEAGILMPVIKVECKYFHPACYDEVLTIRTKVSGKVTVRIRFEFEVFHDDGRYVCVGATELAFIDAANHRPCRPPKSILDIIENEQGTTKSE
jgi:acyl-CoA thioester hydrolase